ncbi:MULTISPECIES: hypothetical protein [unclassified Micromonospora]|uniref:hypothetical protein n=1 Tax=unclassified Micromonospora TaxID=2617518 RepID=UPI001182EE5C|nr:MULTISPECIES: hypothetical protein [unclassified Micromonospora]MDI5938338.1 hypothetical protein [Micromonospora sp. DH15]
MTTADNHNDSISVSLIGSFRRHYADVVRAAEIFESAGVRVLSPPICRIVNPDSEYVRFESDPPQSTDHSIQAETTRKIHASDFVYVVAPQGYVGRATCLELGSILDRGIPIYYSETPQDVPIDIAPDAILSPAEVMSRLKRSGLPATDKTGERRAE